MDLFLAFDAFRNHRHMEIPGERHQHLDDGRALIDMEADRLECRRIACGQPRPANSSRFAAAKSTANSERRITTSVSSSSCRGC
ncbi:hypothetical protein ACVWZ4_000767 [Bradyrhizobium sp. USDA 4472]